MNESKFYNTVRPIARFFQAFIFPIVSIGVENIPSGACILCANHSSNSDAVVLALALTNKRHPRFMAKKELESIFFLRWLIKKFGAFFVSRGENDITAIKTSISLLRKGEMLMIFPEGKRVSEKDRAAAKNGAVKLAAKTGVPIVPAYITPQKRFFRKNKVIFGTPYNIDKNNLDPEAESKRLMESIYALGESV